MVLSSPVHQVFLVRLSGTAFGELELTSIKMALYEKLSSDYQVWFFQISNKVAYFPHVVLVITTHRALL